MRSWDRQVGRFSSGHVAGDVRAQPTLELDRVCRCWSASRATGKNLTKNVEKKEIDTERTTDTKTQCGGYVGKTYGKFTAGHSGICGNETGKDLMGGESDPMGERKTRGERDRFG
jgi:hypothetical protein